MSELQASGVEELLEQQQQTVEEMASEMGQESSDLEPSEEVTFTPNLKFKVHDDEYEIEESFKALMTDEESAEKIRKLHEKAYGLDKVVASRDTYKERYEGLEKSIKEYEEFVSPLRKPLEKGDKWALARALNITDDDVKNRAYELASKTDEQLQYEKKLYESNSQYDALNDEMEQIKRQSIREKTALFDMQIKLATQDNADVVKLINERAGDSQYFEKYVRDYGHKEWTAGRKDIDGTMAVTEVVRMFKPLLGQPQPAATPTDTPVVKEDTRETYAKVKGGKSPVKKRPATLDELKKLRSY